MDRERMIAMIGEADRRRNAPPPPQDCEGLAERVAAIRKEYYRRESAGEAHPKLDLEPARISPFAPSWERESIERINRIKARQRASIESKKAASARTEN